MPLRLIAALLAVVLCWTGLTTHERLAVAEIGSGIVSAAALADDAVGSVGDHHLDDQSGAMADVPDAVTAPGVLPLPLLPGERPALTRLPQPESADLTQHPPPPRAGLAVA